LTGDERKRRETRETRDASPPIEFDVEFEDDFPDLEPGAIPFLERFRRGPPQRKPLPLVDQLPRPRR